MFILACKQEDSLRPESVYRHTTHFPQFSGSIEHRQEPSYNSIKAPSKIVLFFKFLSPKSPQNRIFFASMGTDLVRRRYDGGTTEVRRGSFLVYSSDLPLNGRSYKSATERAAQTPSDACRTEAVRAGVHTVGQPQMLTTISTRSRMHNSVGECRNSPATL